MSKRRGAFWVILILVMSCFTGCTSDKNNTDQIGKEQKDGKATKTSMGRYIEKDVKLPKLEENETIIKIIQNKNQEFEVYTVKYSTSGGEYRCYLGNGETDWKKTNPSWLNTTKLLKNNIVTDIFLGEDGNYYASVQCFGEVAKYVIIKTQNKETANSVNIPYLNKITEENGMKSCPGVEGIGILKNGNVVLRDMMKEKELMVFNPKGEKVEEIATGAAQRFQVKGNHIIVMNDQKKIIYYNTETKSIDQTIEYKGNSDGIAYAQKEDGTIIAGDSLGIHRLKKGGTLWETTVDGALNSMNMPSSKIKDIFVKDGEQEEYYITYFNIENFSSQEINSFKHYVYDKNVSAVPEKEITVYSLRENSTIRQAISLFQSQNPDVKVNYVIAMGDKGGVISDYVRTLNTELLSGNGADILVLDELPAASYIEKGVLADISDIISPLEKSDKLVTSISNNYHTNGKVYQMPIRFFVPIILGKEEALRASENMSGIVDYIKKNKELPYTNQMSYRSLLSDYLALNSEELYQKGQLQEDQLKSFLENLKLLAENIQATEEENAGKTSNTVSGTLNEKANNSWFSGDISKVGNKYSSVILNIGSVNDTMIPLGAVKMRNLNYSTIGQRFMPNGLIGLNNSSKESDLAKKFIAYLYSQEIQNTNLNDGFPMIKSSIQKWLDDKKSEGSSMGSCDEEGNYIIGEWPNKEKRDELFKLITEVKKPIESNQILNEMIIEQALPYLKGETDVNQATKAIMTKVNTYLSE